MIRFYQGESRELAELFVAAVHQTAAACYEPEQLNAWAPLPIDYPYWDARCALKRPFIYEVDEAIAGFIEFDPDGHIDCHYVHPHFNRRGIGGALLRHVLNLGARLQMPRIYVEASHVARGLYEKHEFEVVCQNEVERRGVILHNWTMQRYLGRNR